ncbi:PREDICTED: uncharacterized protein LOC105460088, partial [Wasmannia auropunctata]|uniref:uncharacterized protein LOC105460088 n=1 Tax=Wasmannia auropunctata TaxID=64793 RepID=UPI0005EDD28A
MTDKQEKMSTKAKLSKLHCPFTWEILDSFIKHSTVYHESSNNENNPMDDETFDPLEQLLICLFKCYKAVSSIDKDEATKSVEKAGEILIQIQQEKEFCQMIRAIEHVFYATKCFFLYDADDMDGVEEILQNIIDPEEFSNIELGALYGCQSVIWSILNNFGMNEAVDTAKKAVEKNQECALWHFILAKNLRRQRRLQNILSNPSDMEKKHFEIAYAMSKNDMFGVYYLQMRLECFFEYSKERNYIMKKNANERDVVHTAKQILNT